MVAINHKRVNFEHPANLGLLATLKFYKSAEGGNAEDSPQSIPVEELRTRPDIIDRLWDEVAEGLPEDCRWVVRRTPALVHPRSGIIFGVAIGTPVYGLRLPARELSEALQAGARTVWTFNDAWLRGLGREHNTVLDLADWGPEWVFGDWLEEETQWCLAAYEFASKAS